jgi:RimJ/RimL family protein N-acetyltransferase
MSLILEASRRLLLTLRDLTPHDIPRIMDYWYRSPPGFIESMGVDWAKMPSEKEFEASLLKKCSDNEKLPQSKINALIIHYDGKPIGLHTINPLLEGDYGIFHAHFWNKELRGQGLGTQSYKAACEIFMKRFALKRILFKTPVQNRSAIRVKEKLNITCVGEEVINFGLYKEGTIAKVFELKNS